MNIPKSLKDSVLEVGELEKEHRKYSEFHAWWTLKITVDHLDKYAVDPIDYIDWIPFLNLTVVATGMWDDSYGSEVNDWHVYREEVVESKMAEDFWSLMSHLNSEDNKLAREFAAKYIPVNTTLVPVETDPLVCEAPATSNPKVVVDE